MMKRLLLKAFLAMGLLSTCHEVAFAQSVATRPAPQCRQAFDLTAAGTVTYDNRPVVATGTFDKGGCDTWILEVFVTGFSASSITVNAASDLSGAPDTFAAWATAGGTAITGSFPNTTTSRASVTFKDFFPWLQIQLNSKTGTGHTTGVLYGWVSNPAQSITLTGDVSIDVSTLAKESGGNLATLVSVLGAKADAKSTATDTTAISVMQVLKQISASVQAPPSQAVTNAGTFAVQAASTLSAETTKIIGTVNIAASQTIAVTNAGTFATQATLGAETTKIIGTINIAASQSITVANLTTDTADNVAFTENPVGVGGIYLAAPADHTDADKATLLLDIKGRIVLSPETSKVIGTVKMANACKTEIPSIKRYITAGSSDNESEVKSSAGTLCGIIARNAHASANSFVKCTNLTAANTTPGSSAVFFDFIVPFGGGFVAADVDMPFSTALTCYVVTGKADSDATDTAADDVSYVMKFL